MSADVQAWSQVVGVNGTSLEVNEENRGVGVVVTEDLVDRGYFAFQFGFATEDTSYDDVVNDRGDIGVFTGGDASGLGCRGHALSATYRVDGIMGIYGVFILGTC